MTSSASVSVLLSAAVIVGAAMWCVVGPAMARAVPAVSAVVAAQVAAHWGVPADAIELDFGRVAADVAALPASTSCRLAGKGVDGYFVCLFHAAGAADCAMRVRAGVREALPVAARAVAEGATLQAGDLTITSQVHWGAPLAAHAAPEAGWVLRRALAPGDPVRTGDAAPPAVVRPGQPVRLVWARGVIHLEWNGVALNAARVGEHVRARVEGRGDSYDGIAGCDGVVTLAGMQP